MRSAVLELLLPLSCHSMVPGRTQENQCISADPEKSSQSILATRRARFPKNCLTFCPKNMLGI